MLCGVPKISWQQKVKQILAHRSHDDNWHDQLNEKQLIKAVQTWIKDSQYFETKCQEYKLKFFDLSDDFTSRLEAVEKFLVKNSSFNS